MWYAVFWRKEALRLSRRAMLRLNSVASQFTIRWPTVQQHRSAVVSKSSTALAPLLAENVGYFGKKFKSGVPRNRNLTSSGVKGITGMVVYGAGGRWWKLRWTITIGTIQPISTSIGWMRHLHLTKINSLNWTKIDDKHQYFSVRDWSRNQCDICITTYFDIGLNCLITNENYQHKRTSSMLPALPLTAS